MNAHPTWIDHFPENFTWSNAMLVTKGMAPYGAVALEEIERIAERLRRRTDDPDAWWPAKLPPPIVTRLNTEVTRIMRTPEIEEAGHERRLRIGHEYSGTIPD
jgi:hypothetical protein